MDKPLTMVVKETKSKLANVCNESGLPFVILDFILQEIHNEVHSIVEKQSLEEELAYMRAVEEEHKKGEKIDIGDKQV